MRKIVSILTGRMKGIVVFAFILLLLLFFIYCWFIPKIAVPYAKKYVNEKLQGQISVKIGDITFDLIKGFQLKDVVLAGPVYVKNGVIFSAHQIDTDLSILPLLWKKIRIERLNVCGALLVIGRDSKGDWNLSALLDMLNGDDSGNTDIAIDEINISNSQLTYADAAEVGNIVERSISNVSAVIRCYKDRDNELSISGSAKDGDMESVILQLDYDPKGEIMNGRIKLRTKYLNLYSEHYLKSILDPLDLKGEELTSSIYLAYSDNKLKAITISKINKGNISDGDICITGDAIVKTDLVYPNGVIDRNNSFIRVALENAKLVIEGATRVDKGRCSLVVKGDTINIAEVTGEFMEIPLRYNGTFSFAEPQKLLLHGEIGEMKSDYKIEFVTNNHAVLEWNDKVLGSSLAINADIYDIENYAFTANVNGSFQVPDLLLIAKSINIINSEAVNEEVENHLVTGVINVQGSIKKDAEGTYVISDDAFVNVTDLSFFRLDPVSFNFKMHLRDGVFEGVIPKTKFFNGSLNGAVKVSLQKWGIELGINKFDIAEFVDPYPELKGTKGFLSFNIACAGKSNDNFRSLNGGGYFMLSNTHLWEAPVFKQAADGIKNVKTNIKIPDFKKFCGNYALSADGIKVDNVLCEISKFLFNIKGSLSWGGDVDCTVGVILSKSGVLRAIRQILLLPTVIFDVIADSISIHVYNNISDIKYNVAIQPNGIYYAVFPTSSPEVYPDKYDFDELYEKLS